MGPNQVLPLQARVDMGVMAMKGYSTFPKAPALLGPLIIKLFSVIYKTLIEEREVLSLWRDADSVYSTALLNKLDNKESKYSYFFLLMEFFQDGNFVHIYWWNIYWWNFCSYLLKWNQTIRKKKKKKKKKQIFIKVKFLRSICKLAFLFTFLTNIRLYI